MGKMAQKPKGTLKTAFLVSTTILSMSTFANAQEIALQGKTGGLISGKLIEFKNNTYVIDTMAGRLSISADTANCIGEGCPSLEALPIAWDVSLWGKRRAFTEHVEKIAELVDEKTDGEFTLNISYGGLSPSKENLDGIAAGKFEMAQFCAGYHPDKNPSLNVLELPFLGVSSLEEEMAISFAVYEHPATKADMARWNATLLMPSPQPQQNILGTGQPPFSLADFEKMTIRATGGIGKAVEALGAVAKSIPAPEVGAALKSGVVSGVSFAPHAHMSFGTLEGGSWWTTNLNPGTANCPVAVNTDSLEGLPDAFRDALLSSVDEALNHYVGHYRGVTMKAWFPALRERGIMELTFNDQIISSIHEAVATPAAAAWIAENSQSGLPAQELYSLVMKTLGRANGS